MKRAVSWIFEPLSLAALWNIEKRHPGELRKTFTNDDEAGANGECRT